MFVKACSKIRNAVYGIKGSSQVGTNQLIWTAGTAFMVAPGVLVSAAHIAHIRNDITQPVHTSFEVIRAPDIGQMM